MKLFYTRSPESGRSLLRGSCPLIDDAISCSGATYHFGVEDFVAGFTDLEWQYLSSYRWFLDGLSDALRSRNYRALQFRAREILINEGLRHRTSTEKHELSLCHSLLWFD